MTYALSLTGLQVFFVQWQCKFVNYIVSVERITQYMHLPNEGPAIIEGNRPPSNWPGQGKVVLENLKVSWFLIITHFCNIQSPTMVQALWIRSCCEYIYRQNTEKASNMLRHLLEQVFENYENVVRYKVLAQERHSCNLRRLGDILVNI